MHCLEKQISTSLRCALLVVMVSSASCSSDVQPHHHDQLDGSTSVEVDGAMADTFGDAIADLVVLETVEEQTYPEVLEVKNKEIEQEQPELCSMSSDELYSLCTAGSDAPLRYAALKNMWVLEDGSTVRVAVFWVNGMGLIDDWYGSLTEMKAYCVNTEPSLLPSGILYYDVDIETLEVSFVGETVVHAAFIGAFYFTVFHLDGVWNIFENKCESSGFFGGAEKYPARLLVLEDRDMAFTFERDQEQIPSVFDDSDKYQGWSQFKIDLGAREIRFMMAAFSYEEDQDGSCTMSFLQEIVLPLQVELLDDDAKLMRSGCVCGHEGEGFPYDYYGEMYMNTKYNDDPWTYFPPLDNPDIAKPWPPNPRPIYSPYEGTGVVMTFGCNSLYQFELSAPGTVEEEGFASEDVIYYQAYLLRDPLPFTFYFSEPQGKPTVFLRNSFFEGVHMEVTTSELSLEWGAYVTLECTLTYPPLGLSYILQHRGKLADL